jgi:hypothetical protein
MPRPSRKTPAQLAPEPWPQVASPDPVGEVGRQVALRLRDAIGDQSLRAVAATVNVNHSTLIGILAGSTWPDAETIAKLELGLDADIWPGRGR